MKENLPSVSSPLKSDTYYGETSVIIPVIIQPLAF